MKAVIRDGYGYFTTSYFNHTYSNGSVESYIDGLEIKLLLIILQHMNMTYDYVPTPEGFKTEQGSFANLVTFYGKESLCSIG
jgi:hypothetical protein